MYKFNRMAMRLSPREPHEHVHRSDYNRRCGLSTGVRTAQSTRNVGRTTYWVWLKWDIPSCSRPLHLEGSVEWGAQGMQGV